MNWKKYSIAAVSAFTAIAFLAYPVPRYLAQEQSDELKSEFSESETLKSEASESELAKLQEITQASDFHYASSYEELFEKLKEFRVEIEDGIVYSTDYFSENSIMKTEELMEDSGFSAPDTSIARTENTAGNAYSETNRQEQNVDEGDIVKTDGTYIYVLRSDCSLVIYKADGKDSSLLSSTSLSENPDSSIRSMYLDDNLLTIILSEYITTLENDDIVYYTDSKRQAKILTYDVSDPSSPELIGTAAQDGSYSDSRKNGSYLYLFTEYYPEIADTFEDSIIMPRINNKAVPASSFYLPDNLKDSAYLVISSIDIRQPDQILDSKILVSGVSNYYVSPENIYVANEAWNRSSTLTEITKFHYENGQISGVAAAHVRGYLNNSFSMNEYEGNLRVVSTYYGDDLNVVRDFISYFTGEYYAANWTEHNALYVLDSDLNTIGKIEGLAENETIRSARFFGTIGYFVTYRQTDPLFSVDLSDPTAPRILGELKVDGFSSYLHFYGEDRLLGIGYDTDPDTGITNGIKLSMFDTSDPSAVKELDRFVIKGVSWCPAIENYKSILVQPEKNLIGFFCDNRYMLFRYDTDEGFSRVLLYDFYEDMLNDTSDYATTRGLYINDDFYIAGDAFLISFDMNQAFKKEGFLSLL